jgi:tripartite-type tricarboxylate transporter receptor subunit TctC
MTISPEFSINPSLLRSLPYDPYKDFVCISQLTSGQYFLSTHPSVPVRTVKELVALARAQPGRLTYGSSGNGSANHLAGVMFQGMTGTKLIHVPFKGAGPASIALMSGEIDFMFSSTSAAIGNVKSGKLRAVAVTGPKRLSLTPEIPTVAEAGVPQFIVTGWYLMMAPGGTPRDIVTKLNAEIVKAVHSSAVKERFATLGTEPIGSTPEDCAAFVRSEIQKWEKVVKASGAKAD